MKLWLAEYVVGACVYETPYCWCHQIRERTTRSPFMAYTFSLEGLSLSETVTFCEALQLLREVRAPGVVPIVRIIEDKDAKLITVVVPYLKLPTLKQLFESYQNNRVSVPEEMLWTVLAQACATLQQLHVICPSFRHTGLYSNNCFVDKSTGRLILGLPVPYSFTSDKPPVESDKSIYPLNLMPNLTEEELLLVPLERFDVTGFTAALQTIQESSFVLSYDTYGTDLILVQPPEVLQGKGATDASDIWSLGCIVFEGCNGTSPFISTKNGTGEEPPEPFDDELNQLRMGSSIFESLASPLQSSLSISKSGNTSLHTDVTMLETESSEFFHPPQRTSCTCDFATFKTNVYKGLKPSLHAGYSTNLSLTINMMLEPNVKIRITLDTLCRHPIVASFIGKRHGSLLKIGKLAFYGDTETPPGQPLEEQEQQDFFLTMVSTELASQSQLCESLNTNLILATFQGNIDGILMHREYDLGRSNNDGKTALMFAAQKGDLECVKLLLGEAKHQKKDGRTALMLAAENKHLAVVEILAPLEAGIQDSQGWTALMYASWYGAMDCCTILLEETRKQCRKGWSALMIAAKRGHDAICRILVSREAGLYTPTGMVALMFAAQKGHLECCKVLAPFEIKQKDKDRRTALSFALKGGQSEVAALLLSVESALATGMTEATDNSAPLGSIVASNSVEMICNSPHGGSVSRLNVSLPVKDEISRPVIKGSKNRPICSFDEPITETHTSLMRAGLDQDLVLLRKLIEAEAGKRTELGRTCLMLCAEKGYRHSVYLLADIEGQMHDNFGWTALMWAAQYNHTCVFRALELEKGLRNSMGHTALMIAAHCGNSDAIQQLIPWEAGMKDKNGWTAFLHAIDMSRSDCVKLLMEIEISLCDKDTTMACAHDDDLRSLLGRYYSDLLYTQVDTATLRAQESGPGSLRSTREAS
ncbi:Kinase, NEK [Giardia muris]|uniref:Kinase, NEK n=1 Tax=Giardia muris TaxID=5742 RepID=A0A4Z1SNE2_GIAMU|nr:Kinase, NEK [Giardia muris]|eukprot:TNJ27140.1 Kinase, NEK [Giardia muris]